MGLSLEPTKGKTKFIFYSGKGGVGKSTMSCATAVWLAGKGYKTLLVTTDPAPNLSDIFGQKIGHRIVPIKRVRNLSAIEINPDVASEQYRDRMITPMKGVLDKKNIDVMMDQMKSPCVDEVAAFESFIDFMNSPKHDVIVFDTAPTGHTIRLLELPSGWTTELEKGGSTCIGPSSSLQGAKVKYKKAIEVLQDRKQTTFVFVLKPEKSSISETSRSMEELSKLGISTDAIVVNGILPDDAVTDKFFGKKKENERVMLTEIYKTFPMKRLYFPLVDVELNGVDALKEVGRYIFEGGKGQLEIKSVKRAHSTFKLGKNIEKIRPLISPQDGTRFLFFTGKGGVGKSTVACAASVYLAKQGHRTLIVTTDPASHLQLIFGQDIGPEPTRIAKVDGLFAVRIDQKKALDEYRARILDAVADQPEDVRKNVEEDLRSPCAEEMSAFEKFMSHFTIKGYDIVIFDTAPTGHTIRLLELPSDWTEFLDLGSLTKKTSKETRTKYADIIDTMRNRKKSTFVFVVYPEYTPIIEAWRASRELKKQVGIETSLVGVNYILPSEYGKNEFFENRRKQQEKYLAEIGPRFGTPMFLIPLLDHEPMGVHDLERLGRTMFEGQ